MEANLHQVLVDEVVKRCRQRQTEGDCPTVPAYSTEWLEDAICALAPKAGSSEPDDVISVLRAALRKIADGPLTVAGSPDVVSAVQDYHELISEIANSALDATGSSPWVITQGN